MIQLRSLCPPFIGVLCVQAISAQHLPHHIEVRGPKAAFDTEDTETQRTQRNFGYSSPGLSKPFLRYLRTCRTSGPSIPQDDRGPFLRYLRTCRTSGRTGAGGVRVSASGSKPLFTDQPFSGIAAEQPTCNQRNNRARTLKSDCNARARSWLP